MDKEILHTIELGMDAEAFSRSRLGVYLLERCQNERDAALTELVMAEPTDWRAIAQAQATVWRAEMFAAWLEEAITAGMQAEQDMRISD